MSANGTTRTTWLGHSTVLVEAGQGTRLLIDPFIAHNPKFPAGFALPEKIDFILLTHGHGDHVGEAVELAQKHGATIVAIHELANYTGRKGAPKTIGMNLGGTVQLNEVAATMVEAKHSSSIDDADGSHYMGSAAGFVLTVAAGPVVYHAGDTAVFGDMRLIGELYRPELALLPIGGHYTMGPREAAMAARLIGARRILPIHWGTFPVLKGVPGELAAELGAEFEVLRVGPGEPV